jgi:hypothetical protein
MKDHHVTAALYLGTAIAGVVAVVIVARSGSKAAQSIATGVTTAAQAINPLNPDNVASKAANAVVQTVTGDPGTSVGSSTYDFVQWLRGKLGLSTDARADAPATPRLSPTDSDDADMGAAMRAFATKQFGIDLGTYADTISRDDADLGRFGVRPFGVSDEGLRDASVVFGGGA